jgi:hypothetical protein
MTSFLLKICTQNLLIFMSIIDVKIDHFLPPFLGVKNDLIYELKMTPVSKAKPIETKAK